MRIKSTVRLLTVCVVAALPTSDTSPVISPQAQSASSGTYLLSFLAPAKMQIPISSPVEYLSQQTSPGTSPNIPPRAMPLLQGPRRAAPPRKKSAPKTSPPVAEVAPESLGEDTSGVTSEGPPLPVPVPSSVETEVVAADPIADASPSEPASGRPTEESSDGPAPVVRDSEETPEPSSPSAQLPSDASEPRTEFPEESQVDLRTDHDLLRAADPIGLDVPSELPDPRDESEFEESTRQEPSKSRVSITEEEEESEGEGEDETTQEQHIAKRVSEAGGFNPSGGKSIPPPPVDETTTLQAERELSVDTLPEETGSSTVESRALQPGAPLISHSVYQQGGSANAVVDEDDGDNGKY
jgi:hypothetical protein